MTKFHLGEQVSVKVNDKMAQGTIVPYSNGIMIQHSRNLQRADEMNYSDSYRAVVHKPGDYFTNDNVLYARTYDNYIFYNVLLLTGEIIFVNQTELLSTKYQETVRRRINNNRSTRNMNAFLGNQDDEKIPYLPDHVNDNIMSYLIETPFANNINARIDNRRNPVNVNPIVPKPYASYVADHNQRLLEWQTARDIRNAKTARITRRRRREARSNRNARRGDSSNEENTDNDPEYNSNEDENALTDESDAPVSPNAIVMDGIEPPSSPENDFQFLDDDFFHHNGGKKSARKRRNSLRKTRKTRRTRK